MGDHADDLALHEAGLDRVPDGKFYTYWHEGRKYSFKSLEKANEWAKEKGFRLSTTPPKSKQPPPAPTKERKE